MWVGLVIMQQMVGGTSVHKVRHVISSWLQVDEAMEVQSRNIAIPALLLLLLTLVPFCIMEVRESTASGF
jgi:hypothetical protein